MNFRRIKLWIRRRFGLPRWLREFCLAAIVTFVSYQILLNGYVANNIEPRVMDIWFNLRGRIEAPKDVILIGIDEESHKALGASVLEPWPRQLTAKLLQKIAPLKPKAVILDFSYSENRDLEVDKQLAEAMKLSPTYIARLEKQSKGVNPLGVYEEKTIPIEPADIFAKSADLFDANLSQTYGIIRHFKTDSNKNIPSFAPIVFGADAPQHLLPTEFDYLNFYGPPGSIPSISFHDVLSGKEGDLAPIISGKFVLVGQKLLLTYKAQQSDTFLTPYPNPMAGFEIHATAIGNLIDGSWIRGSINRSESGVIRSYKVALFLVISFLLIYSLFYISPIRGLVLVLGSMILWAIISYLAFLHSSFIPGVLVIYGVLPISYALLSLRSHLRARELERAIGLAN